MKLAGWRLVVGSHANYRARPNPLANGGIAEELFLLAVLEDI